MTQYKQAWDAASLGVNVLSLGLSGYQNHREYAQADELHDDAVDADIAIQFQALSQELLVAAKEADRDVWEQQNERFNNLTILAVLVLSVTVSLVTEGSFDDEGEHASGRASWFVLFTALAMTALFVCLTASYLATNNMSRFMSERSGKLSKRIHDLLEPPGGGNSTQKLSAQMSSLLYEEALPSRDGLVNEIKRPRSSSSNGKQVTFDHPSHPCYNKAGASSSAAAAAESADAPPPATKPNNNKKKTTTTTTQRSS